jgi:hypothetical protein
MKEDTGRWWFVAGACAMTTLFTVFAWLTENRSLQSLLWGFWAVLLGGCTVILRSHPPKE